MASGCTDREYFHFQRKRYWLVLPNRFSHGVLEKVIFCVSLQVSPGVAVFSSWPISLGKRVSIGHGAHFDGLGQTGSTGKAREREDRPRPPLQGRLGRRGVSRGEDGVLGLLVLTPSGMIYPWSTGQ